MAFRTNNSDLFMYMPKNLADEYDKFVQCNNECELEYDLLKYLIGMSGIKRAEQPCFFDYEYDRKIKSFTAKPMTCRIRALYKCAVNVDNSMFQNIKKNRPELIVLYLKDIYTELINEGVEYLYNINFHTNCYLESTNGFNYIIPFVSAIWSPKLLKINNINAILKENFEKDSTNMSF